jgi:hypothetical protein
MVDNKKERNGRHKYSIKIEFETEGKVNILEIQKYVNSIKKQLSENIDILNSKVNYVGVNVK